jgi:hypothetical protein
MPSLALVGLMAGWFAGKKRVDSGGRMRHAAWQPVNGSDGLQKLAEAGGRRKVGEDGAL